MILSLSLPLSLTACDEFDPPSVIKDLRLLAVRAEPPEVAPGTTVALTSFIANPDADPLTFHWYACLLPQLGDENDQQAGNSGGQGEGLSDDDYGGTCWRRVAANVPYAVSLGDGESAELAVPGNLFDDDAAVRLGFGFDADTELPDVLVQLLLSVAGLNYTVELVIETPTRRIEVQKLVNVSLADDPEDGTDNPRNVNPAAPILHVSDRAAPTPEPTDVVAVPDRCFLANASPLVAGHTYDLTPLQVERPGPAYQVLVITNTGNLPYQIETRTEDSYYTFFATKGDLEDNDLKAVNVGAKNVWRLGKDDSGPADLWIVRRDGRGGIDWCHEPVVIGVP